MLPRSIEGPDPMAGSVAFVFLFAVCWRTDVAWRALTLVAIGVGASKPFASTIFEGWVGVAAGLELSLDVAVVTAGCLLLGPIARATARTRLARA